MNLDYQLDHIEASIECSPPPIDKYDITNFAREDTKRFLELVDYLSPRDQEMLILFALLQKRPTDLSILFGKAGHRAQEDLHKAAHKLSGLVEFGCLPVIQSLAPILERSGLGRFGSHEFAACIWQYARCRDFSEMAHLLGTRGLRQAMLRAAQILHVKEGREEGLLAGWILWLVDGADPKGRGWKNRQRGKRQENLGPTVFRTFGNEIKTLNDARPATQRGGRAQRTHNVKIKRHEKFIHRQYERYKPTWDY